MLAGLDDNSDSENNNDQYEVLQMKKINQRFSKLMSFNIEHKMNEISTQDMTMTLGGKYNRQP